MTPRERHLEAALKLALECIALGNKGTPGSPEERGAIATNKRELEEAMEKIKPPLKRAS